MKVKYLSLIRAKAPILCLKSCLKFRRVRIEQTLLKFV